MKMTRTLGRGLGVASLALAMAACETQFVDYQDDAGSGGAGASSGGKSNASSGGNAASGGRASASGGHTSTGGLSEMGGDASFWPELPVGASEAPGTDPFDYAASQCPEDKFPVGSGERWVETVPVEGNEGPYNTITFQQTLHDPGTLPVRVQGPLGAEIALWETDLEPPVGLVGSPVYWVGAVGGTPIDASFGLSVNIPQHNALITEDPDKVNYYYSVDGETFESVQSGALGAIVPETSFFILLASEAGGWSCEPGAVDPEVWPELPTSRGTVSGIDPFVMEDTNCSEADFPVGSGKRWIQTVPVEGNDGVFNTVTFTGASHRPSLVPLRVTALIGTEVAVWETELAPPEGLAASPVYWVGAVGGTPPAEGLATMVVLDPGIGVLDPDKVKYYFSEDGEVYEPVTAAPGGVLPESGFVFLGSEAGGWNACPEDSAMGGASN
jgi:hypothetical protein